MIKTITKSMFLLILPISINALTVQADGPQPIDLKELLEKHKAQQAQKNIPTPEIKINPPQTPPKNIEIEVPTSPEKTILQGLIQVSSKINKLPEIKLLYSGNQTFVNQQGFYSFPIEDEDLNKVYILICNQINTSFDGINTIENLNIDPNKKYRFFSLKKIELQENKYRWEWKEKTLQKKDFVIPQNCIIVLINPKYFEQLDEWKIHLLDKFIGLPKIVLNENITQDKLSRTGVKSHLYTLDNQYFHETIKQESKEFENQPNVKVVLAREANS
ncbi:MAG: hypothetical protein ABIA74_05385 [bacterium]